MKIFLTAAIFFFFVPTVFAGGPYVVDTSGRTGVAQHWDNKTLTWYSDDGPLSSSVNNQTGRQWISDALATWRDLTIPNADRQEIKTVDLTVNYGGSIGKDVNATNYAEYIDATSGPSVIMFDADGGIMSALGIDKTSVVGVTAPVLSNASTTAILKGFSIFNGTMLEANRLSADATTAQQLFRATMLHELGHLLGLDHAQVNLNIALACTLGSTCTDGQFIPAMFPELKTILQGIPKRDDEITLSWIYPTADFGNQFCVIRGQLQDADGNPLRGVNVVASRVGEGDTMTKQDARAMVSGVLYAGCANDSHYYLYGIVPGKDSQVTYEPLAAQYSGQSGFEPLNNPPTGFSAGTIAASGGATTVSCDKGGETIDMPTVKISVRNPCTSFSAIAAGAPGSGGGDQGSSSSGGCSLSIH